MTRLKPAYHIFFSINIFSIWLYAVLVSPGLSVGQNLSFGTTVNPEEYIVAPGDRFQINFWDGSTEPVEVTVTSEGFVLLESMGQVSVGGLKLNEARAELNRLIGRFYPELDFSISLKGVRQVKMLISGGVKNPGLYDGNVSQRVSEIIDKAGGLIDGASQRNIELSSDHYDYIVDLIKFNRTGDLAANPYLYSGHHVHVPMVFDSSAFVHVSGEVVQPGRLEYKEGDNLGIFIEMAYGLTGLQGDEIKIRHRGGNEEILIGFTPENLAKPVRPGDKIIIGRNVIKAKSDYIILTGEVMYPGIFVYNEVTTLQSAIDMAGGLTEDADIHSTGIYRLFSQEALVSIPNNQGSGFGRGSAGLFPLTLGNNLSESEFGQIRIAPGDSIYIPAITGSIGIYGLVKYPGQVAYSEPRPVFSLIRQAGGFSPNADRKNIQIVRKTTGMKAGIGPADLAFDGDLVLVNQRAEESTLLSKLRDAAIIIGAIGITYLAIDNLMD